MENPLLEMRVDKNAIDHYMLLHTDESVIGKKIRYDLGYTGATIIVGANFAYSSPNPTSVVVLPTAKGDVRMKFFLPKKQ